MNSLKTESYIGNIPKDRLPLVYEALLDAIKRCESYILVISKWLILVVFLYFLFSAGVINEIEISGAKVNLEMYFEVLVPVIASLLILFYIVTAIHKAECVKSYNIVFLEIFGNDCSNTSEFESLSIQTLPISILNRLLNQNNMKTPKGCFYNILIIFPLSLIQLLPYVFIVYSLSIIIKHHWELGLAKSSFYFSCFFIVLGFILFFNTIYKGVKEEK